MRGDCCLSFGPLWLSCCGGRVAGLIKLAAASGLFIYIYIDIFILCRFCL